MATGADAGGAQRELWREARRHIAGALCMLKPVQRARLTFSCIKLVSAYSIAFRWLACDRLVPALRAWRAVSWEIPCP